MIILFAILIIAMILYSNYLQADLKPKQEPIRVVINERYARGEISQEQYQNMKEQLNQ